MRINKTNTMAFNVEPWKIPSRLTLMVATGMIVSSCASTRAPETITDATLDNRLLQKIDQRDKLIDDLQRRVQQLEHSAVATSQVKSTNSSVAAAQATSPANQPPAQQKPATAQPGKPAAGSFEVDVDAAQRALERTLVQTGALLLPFGQAEIQPFVNYTRTESKETLPALDRNNLLQSASIRRNEFDMGANLLVGLPFESQAEFRIPYQFINQSVAIPNGPDSRESSNTGNSLGNISVGLAKTLTHESNWIPDLIARLTWDTPSGSVTSNNVGMGGGNTGFTASMTALKRQDPLAFTGRVGYTKTLKKNDIEPGDQLSLSVGATLAASPQTSLSIGLQQSYIIERKINNVIVQGSDAVSSAFTVGASSTIGRNLFFSVLGGIGLTNSSPAYFLNITIPFRFDIPFKSTENKS